MNETATRPESAEAATTEAIREACQLNKSEPGAIWDTLEAQGVETTPGVIYQAFHAAEQLPAGEHASKLTSGGLTTEDMVLLWTLAGKAGGVDHLLRILSLWKEIGK